MAKISIYKFKNIFIILFILIFISSANLFNSFAEITYGEYFFELSKYGSGSRAIITTDGKFVLNLENYKQNAYLINDFKTEKPRVFLKTIEGYYRNFDRNVEKTKHYNPILKREGQNLIEDCNNTWWRHGEMQYTENILITKNKYEFYDLEGNKLFKEFYYEGHYSLDKIFIFDEKLFFVKEEDDEEVMYLYNMNTKEMKKIGNYRVLDLYDDKIILYSARDFYNGVETVDKSNVSFFDKNMKHIKTFDGYSKIDYFNINNDKYYVLTYNKRVKNKNKDEVVRYANFLDKNLKLIFDRDILVDYERIEYDFDYKKVFNENINKNENTILGPHDELLDMKNVELIIELDNENLYIVSDKKGFYICDKDNNIIGNVFDKHIYLCNFANTRDKLIFSYRTDEVSYFKDLWSRFNDFDDWEEWTRQVFYLDKEDVNAKDVKETNIIYDCFFIDDNKLVYLPKIDDMVILPLTYDGLYAYYPITGNSDYKYIKKLRNDNINNFKNRIFDLKGNIVAKDMPITYQANLYIIDGKYFIDNHNGMSYVTNDSLFDFESNEIFDLNNINESSYNECGNCLVFAGREYINKEWVTFIKIYDKDINFIKEIKDAKNTSFTVSTDDKYIYIDYDSHYSRYGVYVYDKDFNFVKEIKSINEIKGINKTKPINGDKDLIIYKTKRKVEMPIDWRKRYYIFTNDKKTRYSLYDEEKKEYIFKDYKYLGVYNEKYLIYQYGFKYGLMDLEGNRLCELSVFDNFEDDFSD